jgi:hypothetical protein
MKIKAPKPCETCGGRVNLEQMYAPELDGLFIDVIGICVDCGDTAYYNADDFDLNVLKHLKGFNEFKQDLEVMVGKKC